MLLDHFLFLLFEMHNLEPSMEIGFLREPPLKPPFSERLSGGQ
jgi:hypothetical protein